MNLTFSCLHVVSSGYVATKAAKHQPVASSDESDDEDESVKSADGAEPGKVMLTHPTPLSLPSSLCWSLLCPYADPLLSWCVLRHANAGSLIDSHLHHLCTCISDTHVLEQGAAAAVTVPPSAETISPSDEPDKTVQVSDKSVPPSPKPPKTRRALSQPPQRRTAKPLDFVSTSASQPEV
jgi:hypothetical protein